MEGLDMGSDHDVFRESSFGIPGLYLHDWPDRYIHTNFDTAAMIDPTKLKRAAFIGAVNALILANLSDDDVPAVLELLKRNAISRGAELIENLKSLNPADASAASRIHFTVERRKIHSIEAFAVLTTAQHDAAADFVAQLESLLAPPDVTATIGNDTVYVRNAEVQGPMTAFGYDYLPEQLGEKKYAGLRLPAFSGSRGSGSEYAYEALNLVDGSRSVSDIRDWLMTELGPVPVEFVAEYLDALGSIGVIQLRKKLADAPSE
jgi:hypothetical protein